LQLALIEAAGPGLQLSASREAARIVRPWAVLAWGAVAYMAYTAYDSLPLLLHHQARAVAVVTSAVIPRAAAPAAPAQRLQMVTKCIDDSGTTYSDTECAPGVHAERIVLAPSATPAVAPASHLQQQVCTDIADQVHRIEVKSSLAPSGADHAWLEARRQEARMEQARLGC
jgi:hypothetical protein